MKNEKINTPDPVKRWLTEAGTDAPGEGFHFSVLKKIEALSQSKIEYKPVISPLGWKLILGLISSIFAWSIFFAPAHPEKGSLFGKLPDLKIPSIDLSVYKLSFPSLDFSTNLLLGISTFFIIGSLLIVSTLRNKQTEL